MEAAPDKRSLLPRGRLVGSRYRIESVIGEGSSGVVYLAHDPGGARVALKVIHRHLCSDRQIHGRFQREANILKRLEAPHLVKLLDFIEEDDLLIIALEYVDGRSLESLLKDKVIDLGAAVEITLQICAALGTAHAAGVVHRDLKPGNVLVEHPAAEQSGVRVRVVDFGLAKVLHGEQMTTGLTEQDMIFGTPEYMAPEQARGDEVDLRCDLYATGIMLYEMAVGDVPFRGRTPIASMTLQLTESPPPPRSRRPDRGITVALETVILRALAKEPADRYDSARAFAEALVAARDQTLVIAPRQVVDAASLATGDTDLSLSTSQLAFGPTETEDPGTRPLAQDAVELAGAPTVRASTQGGRWFWTIVALLALIAGMTIGALVGLSSSP